MNRSILLSTFFLFSCSPNDNSIQEHSILHDDVMRTFYTYVPSNIGKEMTLVVGLHGYTGNAETFIRKGDADFNNFLEMNNFIGAYPEGKSFYANGRKFSSWNDLAGSIGQGPKGDICDIDRDYYPFPPDCVNPHRCSWASCGDDIGFIEKVIDHHKNQYDIKSVIVIGMSNGGMLAQAIGCKLAGKVDAIINIEGMQALGMSCIPDKPLTMVIYGAKNDTTVPPEDILASDGYFYEPMKNTVNDWKNAFNCSNSTKKQILNPAEITEEHFYDCNDGVTITSILDHNNDHDWPKPYKWGIDLLFAPILN
ncbi:MAG: esterase [Gammaproteobacteria bacterium]|nr:MAG: esterase [Gammaproteobacteria bacterium]